MGIFLFLAIADSAQYDTAVLKHFRQFEDIMYYFMRYRTKLQSRADIVKYSGLSAGDVEALRGVYKN